MNTNEMLSKMYRYSEVEIYLRDNPEKRYNYNLINHFKSNLDLKNSKETLDEVFNKADTNLETHLSTIPTNYFFADSRGFNIAVSQHTRYTTPFIHKHEFYELFYVLEGEFKQLINYESFNMRTGDVCLIPPGIYHSLDVNNYSVVLNVLIEKESFENLFFYDNFDNSSFSSFFSNNLFSYTMNKYYIFQTVGDSVTRNYILDIYLEMINKAPYYSETVQAKIKLLFINLLRYFNENVVVEKINKAKNELEMEIINFIDKNYSNVSLDSLSNEFNYSQQYISSKIKEASGLSFKKYLTNKRMNVATELLINSNLKIHEISENIGYLNQENFSRIFRRFFDITPSRYRKLHK